MSRLNFQLEAEAPGSRARAGRFQTLHGEVLTPIFMPVGTQATVKSQSVDLLRAAGSRILLANTYHLLLRPGPEVFRKFGGIHRFMNWDGPVLTDSGGFQIFKLHDMRQMSEDGARFQSYVDGDTYLLSPEASIEMQKAIGSDIMMVLDQCIPSTAGKPEAIAAMELTHRWAKRSLDARGDSPQAMFGIAQGACFHDLRKQSVDFLTQLPFDGFAIGGLAVGETKGQREEFCEATAALLPRNLPRYLMGVGTPIDILEAVHRGVDMFDCIIPSAFAQQGVAFTSRGKLQLKRSDYKFDEAGLDPDCDCPTCEQYSRAYLHHLHKAYEPLGWTLVSTHNIHFYHRLMREMRSAILDGTFSEYYRRQRETLVRVDTDHLPESVRRPPKKAPRVLRLGNYEIQESETFASVRQISSGEVMHSVSDPTEEANRLYVQQSRLAERLADVEPESKGPEGTSAPLVIWDVGLGAATNAMAAVQAYERVLKAKGVVGTRPLKIVSFEIDLDPLRLALKHQILFPHLWHSAPHYLLKDGRWASGEGHFQWELHTGDFLMHLDEAERGERVLPPPDLIFYDPFSPRVDSALWTPAAFAKLFDRCSERAVELFTYSNSTAVRAGLLSAGFFVGAGASTGPKAETTMAFTRPGPGLLGPEWLSRWQKSNAKFPVGLKDGASVREKFEAAILAHPQFSSVGDR
ncbi:MAG: tRNA guanosine(34) transglycosylase Tgt [Bacteriovoracia bacterium]